MKKILLASTAILLLTVVHGQTNVYHPFPDSNVIWNEHRFGLNGTHTCSNEDYYSLFINGDTILGGKVYHKLYKQGYTVYSCWNPPTTPVYHYYGTLFATGIRQDSSQKKVFTWVGRDSLLYDFNLTVGDTLRPSIANGYHILVVNKIDSVLIGGKYHKRFTCQGSGPTLDDTLIEGIGSVMYGLYNLKGVYPDGGSNFVCFAYDTVTYPANSNCVITTNTTDVAEKTIPSITLSPNPFSIQTSLRMAVPLMNATLTLDNCFGQTVAQIKNINGKTVTFSRDNLTSGLYFVRLIQDNKVLR